MMRLKRLLIGRPLKSEEAQGQHLSKTSALAIFSSSALSSVSYGPEQIALALAVPGLIAYGYFLYALIPILALLAAVTISYTQVAKANPGGGGAYSVAKENLGGTARPGGRSGSFFRLYTDGGCQHHIRNGSPYIGFSRFDSPPAAD